MPGLNNDERNQAIQMLNEGTPATVISRHFGCTRKTIEPLQRRFRVTGNIADRLRSGRPRATTAADDCYIVLQHLGNRRLTAAATGRQYGTCIHPQTVRNRLRQKHSTYSCVPTILRSNSHPMSSNGKAGLVPPSTALPTCWLAFDFVFRCRADRRESLSPSGRAFCPCVRL